MCIRDSREDVLPDELRERLLRLVVRDRREVRLHITDEDGVRLDAAVLELPLVEGELPERLVDDDAARPLARVIGTCIGEEVAEQVLEGALGESQLAHATPLRTRRPGQLLDALAVAHEAQRRLLRRCEPLEVGHKANLVESGSDGLGIVCLLYTSRCV